MAPAVPFALLGVVQLTAVAAWIALAGAATFPRLRRRVTPVFVLGAVALAAADTLCATRFGPAESDPVAWLRCAGFGLLALGVAAGAAQSLVVAPATSMPALVAPLGARPAAALAGAGAGTVAAVAAWWRGLRPGADRVLAGWLAVGLVLAAAAAGLAAPARTSTTAALAVLAVRAASTAALVGALVQLSRTMLLGKLVGAIVAGVVAMASGAVGVVGTGVAGEVQSQQSQRLLDVARAQQANLPALTARAGLFAQVVALCPTDLGRCVQALTLFSEQPNYFAVLVRPGTGATVVAPRRNALGNAALVQLAGSPVVRAALQPGATAQTVTGGPMLLQDSPPRLAVVAAVPGRPGASTDARLRPTYAAVYGVSLVDAYLHSLAAKSGGYDISVIADGKLLASSLPRAEQESVLADARTARVDAADPTAQTVVPAEGDAPTVAFVPVTAAGNDDVRIATLAVSQPANEALRAQRNVLQRLFLTALVALVVVAGLAVLLARRIADPVRRLTVAAGRVRRGDLEATTTLASRDEVGLLSRAFDAMTASLRRLTGELRATAAEQTALRARLETVVESMNDGLVAADADDVVTSANRMALQLLDASIGDVVGRPLRDVLRVRDDEGRDLLAAPPGADTVDAELLTASGGSVPVRFGAASLADGEGRVVVVADRTREREVERMKTEFLANISHELRTPLTPIRGYAELISRRSDLSRQQVAAFVEEILGSTARMSRAVELLVDVAALEGGRVAVTRQAVPVRTLVDDRLAAWKSRYPERASDFKRKSAAKLPAVEIDEHWVSRALDELADNAVKYTAPGTPITLVAAMDGDPSTVRVAVRDGGPGFDPQRAGELVGDFAQADASETRKVGGMGLGLGFVSRVAERLGLHFTVETEPGRGSEFGLDLPAAADRPARRAVKTAPARADGE